MDLIIAGVLILNRQLLQITYYVIGFSRVCVLVGIMSIRDYATILSSGTYSSSNLCQH
jgi:hypothetical protein